MAATRHVGSASLRAIGGLADSRRRGDRLGHVGPPSLRHLVGRAMSKWQIARIILLSLALSIGITASMIVAVVASRSWLLP